MRDEPTRQVRAEPYKGKVKSSLSLDLALMSINLITSDNQPFVVEKSLAIHSKAINEKLDENKGVDITIQLPGVDGSTLEKVLEYLRHYKDEPVSHDCDNKSRGPTELSDWDKTFLEVEQSQLFKIILAADYLGIKPLLDAGCKAVALQLKGKTPEQIREAFSIQNDFTPEEEARIKEEFSG